jgi:colanic acid/amylovoran biosynthesis glycosyltransferase
VRIAYIVGRYPSVTHTFIQREIEALRRLGVSIETVSIHRPREQDTLSTTAREEARRTHAILPPSPLSPLFAHLTALVLRPRQYLRALRLTMALSRPGIKGHIWYLFYFSEAVLAWRFLRRRGVQHLHAHHLNQAGDVALLAATLGGWTWSFTMHGPSEFSDVRYWRVAEKSARANFVACISDFCRSQLMGLTGREHWRKLRVVHCGVDPQVFRAETATVGEGDSAFEILNVGQLAGRKGQVVLLEALGDLLNRGLDVRLTIVGEGEIEGDLRRISERLGLSEVVCFAGAVGQDSIHGYYERADVFCLPSFAEGVPVVLMEAMAMGLPVVAANVMGVPELVDDGVNGLLVRPGRADQLAEAIRRLALDPELCERFGSAGRRKVVTSFHIAQSAEALARAFTEVTRSDSGREQESTSSPVTAEPDISEEFGSTERGRPVAGGIGRD